MNPFVRNSIIVISCLFFASPVFAWPKMLPKEPISLTANAGVAPFSVRIVGPNDLVASAVGYPEQFSWCDFKVSWGDGGITDFYKDYKQNLTPNACSSGLDHIYQKPGRFTIKVIKFHTGPNDKIVNDWIGIGKVTVKKQ